MIKEKMYEKVQFFKRQGYSISEIASDMEIDPRTAAKYYVMNGRQFKADSAFPDLEQLYRSYGITFDFTPLICFVEDMFEAGYFPVCRCRRDLINSFLLILFNVKGSYCIQAPSTEKRL